MAGAVGLGAEPGRIRRIHDVELAARLMVGLAERIPQTGVTTAHVTYPHEVTVATLLALFEHRYPLKLELIAKLPEPMSRRESLAAGHLGGFAPFGFQRRYYDRAALRAAGLDPLDAPPLDLEYLLSGI